MVYALIITYGLVLGSFFNVVGLRVPAGQSVFRPNSACPTCGRRLNDFELIPVLSYLIQRGKCRYCHGRISALYPLMELVTAFAFVHAFATYGMSLDTVLAWSLAALLIIVTVSDLRYMIIPNKILLIFFFIFALERMVVPLKPRWDSLVGASVAFILLYAIAVVSRGGMGGGDVKLFTCIGFFVGWQVFLLAFFLATLIGSMIGIIGMITGTMHRKSAVPFAPSIAVGTWLAYFYYEPIVDFYLSFFS